MQQVPPGGPPGDCTTLVVGLADVINSAGRIHEGERPGRAVLSIFSGFVLHLDLGFPNDTSLRRGLLVGLTSRACSTSQHCAHGSLLARLPVLLRLKQLRLGL